MDVPEHRVAPAPATTGAPVTLACRAVVDDLSARGIGCATYLLLDGRLRCTAAQGLATVLDGFVPPDGEAGRAVATGRTVVGAGVVCAPVAIDGRFVGAVLVDASGVGDDEATAAAEAAASTLAAAVSDVGGVPAASVGQRLAHLALELTAAPDRERLHRLVVEGATRLAGASSAAVADVSPGGTWRVTAATGPLAQAVSEWSTDQLGTLVRSVHAGVAAHVGGDTTPPATHEFLARAGVVAIGTYPMVVAGELVGLLLVADTAPRTPDPVATAAVEVLAALAGASLRSAGLLADLAERGRGALDALPGADEFRDDLTDGCITAIRSGEVTHTSLLVVPTTDAPDDVLGTLVEAVLGQLRYGDRLYRTADQELAVLLATGSPESAAAVTGRLDRAARDAGVPVVLGWALVDGPPAAVTAATRASLEAASG